MKRILGALAIAATLSAPALAQSSSGVELGVLDCVVAGGAGFIIGSSKDLTCTFDPAGDAPNEPYFGLVQKFGLDIGITGKTVIAWLVLAPSADVYSPGALAGDYVGASAEATVGVGVGANALVGGSNRTFVLQPLSVQAQRGLNLAVGFSNFQLRSVQN